MVTSKGLSDIAVVGGHDFKIYTVDKLHDFKSL